MQDFINKKRHNSIPSHIYAARLEAVICPAHQSTDAGSIFLEWKAINSGRNSAFRHGGIHVNHTHWESFWLFFWAEQIRKLVLKAINIGGRPRPCPLIWQSHRPQTWEELLHVDTNVTSKASTGECKSFQGGRCKQSRELNFCQLWNCRTTTNEL